MPERHIIEAARALRTHTARSVRRHSPKTYRAIVRQQSPLRVELVEGRSVLDEDDLVLAHAVRKYDNDYGLAVGDTLLLSTTPGGEFIATSVIASSSGLKGTDKTHVATPGEFIGGGPVVGGGGGTVAGTAMVGKVAFRDDDGNIIGYVPLI